MPISRVHFAKRCFTVLWVAVCSWAQLSQWWTAQSKCPLWPWGWWTCRWTLLHDTSTSSASNADIVILGLSTYMVSDHLTQTISVIRPTYVHLSCKMVWIMLKHKMVWSCILSPIMIVIMFTVRVVSHIYTVLRSFLRHFEGDETVTQGFWTQIQFLNPPSETERSQHVHNMQKMTRPIST